MLLLINQNPFYTQDFQLKQNENLHFAVVTEFAEKDRMYQIVNCCTLLIKMV